MGTKIVFGAKGLKSQTPKVIRVLLRWLKRVSMAVAATSTFQSHEFWGLTFMAFAWLVDELEPLFGEIEAETIGE